MFLKGVFFVALVLKILEYYVYTPVSRTSGRLEYPLLKIIILKKRTDLGMKKIFGLLLGVMFAANVVAQEEGVVVLHQDSIMESLLVKKESKDKNIAITAVGYRVQVYSNNNARKAKSEAFDLEEKLNEVFPEVKSYVTYSAPFWKVRLGDFSNYAEAVIFSKKVKSALPKLANEIIVIKENSTKPLYLNENNSLPEAE